jgi:hypothetical protein
VLKNALLAMIDAMWIGVGVMPMGVQIQHG